MILSGAGRFAQRPQAERTRGAGKGMQLPNQLSETPGARQRLQLLDFLRHVAAVLGDQSVDFPAGIQFAIPSTVLIVLSRTSMSYGLVT